MNHAESTINCEVVRAAKVTYVARVFSSLLGYSLLRIFGSEKLLA